MKEFDELNKDKEQTSLELKQKEDLINNQKNKIFELDEQISKLYLDKEKSELIENKNKEEIKKLQTENNKYKDDIEKLLKE